MLSIVTYITKYGISSSTNNLLSFKVAVVVFCFLFFVYPQYLYLNASKIPNNTVFP